MQTCIRLAVAVSALAILLPPVTRADDTLTVEVSDTFVAPVSPNMASFSFEVSGFPSMIGMHPDPPKPSFIQLVSNLQKMSNMDGPYFRIGGNSADKSWWNPDGLPKPAGISYDITQNDLLSYRAFLDKITNSKIIIDTCMLPPKNASWAANHVRAALNIVGQDYIHAVEIGNENDLFSGNGIRSENYTYDDYAREFKMYVDTIYSTTPLAKRLIQGGTFCCGHFDKNIKDYLKDYHDSMTSFSYHRYPTSNCHGSAPTLEELLLDDAATAGQAQRLAPWAKEALGYDMAMVLGEGNSCSCGGYHNLSDVLGSAVWATDFLFNLASVNVSMANFHGGGEGAYTAIGYKNESTQIPDVRPLYYGMYLFTMVTANNSNIVDAKVDSSNSHVKAWAVKDAHGRQRVTVIHKDYKATSNCQVTVSFHDSSATSARLYQLVGNGKDGVLSHYGLNFAGITFDNTKDGRPIGNLSPKTLSGSDGKFTFEIAPATVAFIEAD